MTKTLAAEYFEAQLAEMALESRLTNALLEATGADPMDPDTWPCEDFIFDSYDGSFEFINTNGGFEPTRAMKKAWGKLGFDRCWICYKDGRHAKSERYYSL